MNTTGYKMYETINGKWNVEPDKSFVATWNTEKSVGLYSKLSFFLEQTGQNEFTMQYNPVGSKDVTEVFDSLESAMKKADEIAG